MTKERMMILEMVNEGKITPEEALLLLDAMGEGLHAILDVTIVYPAGTPSLVDLLADRIPEVQVRIRQREIPAALLGGDYQADRAFRARFQQWMNGVWEEKDADIAAMLTGEQAQA
jgi:hypothetical protein